jgi:hypothetical protein
MQETEFSHNWLQSSEALVAANVGCTDVVNPWE